MPSVSLSWGKAGSHIPLHRHYSLQHRTKSFSWRSSIKTQTRQPGNILAHSIWKENGPAWNVWKPTVTAGHFKKEKKSKETKVWVFYNIGLCSEALPCSVLVFSSQKYGAFHWKLPQDIIEGHCEAKLQYISGMMNLRRALWSVITPTPAPEGMR